MFIELAQRYVVESAVAVAWCIQIRRGKENKFYGSLSYTRIVQYLPKYVVHLLLYQLNGMTHHSDQDFC